MICCSLNLASSPRPPGSLRTRILRSSLATGGQVRLSVHMTPSHAQTRFIVDEGLGSSNDLVGPLDQVRPLACFARLPSGRVVGGAVGRTWGSYCELRQLWVEPAHRRHGIGTRLVKEFKRCAEARSCRTFYLETFRFQAPELYRLLGYSAKLELHGVSWWHSEIYDGARGYLLPRG
jgi:GNAT superfamily N-acetyltransferase